MIIRANSIQQYNKWKSWLKGDVKESDMYILAETYINDFYSLFGSTMVHNGNTKEMFDEFAEIIQLPENINP